MATRTSDGIVWKHMTTGKYIEYRDKHHLGREYGWTDSILDAYVGMVVPIGIRSQCMPIKIKITKTVEEDTE